MLVSHHIAAAMFASACRVVVPNAHRSEAARTRRASLSPARRLRRLQRVTLGVLVASAFSGGVLPSIPTVEVRPASVNATITSVESPQATGQHVLGQPRVAATASGTVTASLLYLRAGPGTTYRIIGQMPRGTKLTILAEQPDWYKVRTPLGYVGWASSKYILRTGTSPSPTPTPVPGPIDLNKYPTEYTTPNGYVYTGRRAQVLHHVKERYSTRVTTYASHSDCPTCSADLWTPDARGGVDNSALPSMNAVAEYVRANDAALGIKYIIWNQRIWLNGTWQDMADRGGITANHKDHIHITFKDSFQ